MIKSDEEKWIDDYLEKLEQENKELRERVERLEKYIKVFTDCGNPYKAMQQAYKKE